MCLRRQTREVFRDEDTGCVGRITAKEPRIASGGFGLERLLELVKQTGALDAAVGCDVYVVHQSAEGRAAARLAFQVAEDLRTSGLDVILHCGGGSFKSQMKKADASGAEYAVIIGDDELAAGEVSVKPLRGEGAQQRVAVAQLAQRMVEIFPEELES